MDVQPTSGRQVRTVHIKDVKVILPVDRVLNEIPDYTNYGRKSKLDLDSNKIPELNWALSTRIHTYTTPTTTVSTPSQTVTTVQSKLPAVITAVSSDVAST